MVEKVGLLGPEGTYTHEAAREYFGKLKPEYYSTVREVFESGLPAVVPLENSLGGSVGETVDSLKEFEVEVTGEQSLKIEHCLLSKEKDINDVDKVRSHPQALSQCRGLIEKYGWQEIEAASTARAAKQLDKGEAALASRLAGELNDLNILKEGVQDSNSNETRFLILNYGDGGEAKSSLVIEPGEDRPGLLHSMLGCFAGHEINLSHIQSRPTRDRLGEYFFYIEAEASQTEERFQKAVKCLETYANVQVLGSYNGDTV